MRKIETYGDIKDGILKIHRRSDFDKALKIIGDAKIKLTVERLYKKRSSIGLNENGELTRLQNGFYWGVVVREYQNGALSEQQRVITSDQAHEELKANCNFQEHYNDETGVVMRSIKSTSDLTTVQFCEYVDRCRAFILEWFNIDVPEPGTQTQIDIYQ